MGSSMIFDRLFKFQERPVKLDDEFSRMPHAKLLTLLAAVAVGCCSFVLATRTRTHASGSACVHGTAVLNVE